MDEDVKIPKLTGTAKLDATTDAAYAIIDKGALERDLKTNRLRALRLAKEAAELDAAADKAPRKRPPRKAKVAAM